MFKKLNNTHKLFTKYNQVNKLFSKNSNRPTYTNINNTHQNEKKYKNGLEK